MRSNAKTASLAAQALARAAAGARAHVLHPPAVAVRGQLTLVVKAFVISVFEASGNRLAAPAARSMQADGRIDEVVGGSGLHVFAPVGVSNFIDYRAYLPTHHQCAPSVARPTYLPVTQGRGHIG